MQILLLLAISCLSGIFAGMGMGGGTFLIPLLSIVFGTEQIICQSTNVMCFILLAGICFAVYIKNGLIDFRTLVCVAAPASVISFFASLFAIRTSSTWLRICFAVFLICIGAVYFFCAICSILKKKSKQKN